MSILFGQNKTRKSGISMTNKGSSARIILSLTMALGMGIVGCGSNPNSNNYRNNSTNTSTESSQTSTTCTVVDPLLDQAKKAKESEGKFTLGSMKIGQEAYFLEQNKFATSVGELQLGIKADTANYAYKIESTDATQVIMTATSKKPDLKSFIAVVIVDKPNTPEATTVTISCATESASTKPPTVTSKVKSAAEFQCPAGSTKI